MIDGLVRLIKRIRKNKNTIEIIHNNSIICYAILDDLNSSCIRFDIKIKDTHATYELSAHNNVLIANLIYSIPTNESVIYSKTKRLNSICDSLTSWQEYESLIMDSIADIIEEDKLLIKIRDLNDGCELTYKFKNPFLNEIECLKFFGFVCQQVSNQAFSIVYP